MKTANVSEKLPTSDQIQKTAEHCRELIMVGNGINMAIIETEAKLTSLKSELSNVQRTFEKLQKENSAVFAVLAAPTGKKPH